MKRVLRRALLVLDEKLGPFVAVSIDIFFRLLEVIIVEVNVIVRHLRQVGGLE